MTRLFILLLFIGILSPLYGQWETKNSMPSIVDGRHHPVTFASDQYGYFATGSSNTSDFTNDFYKYAPAEDAWTQLPDFPGIARSFSIGVRSGNKGYLGFGRSIDDRLNDLWEFDFATEEWTELATCPCDGRTHPAFLASEDGKLYVGLGSSATSNLNDWWAYDIATNTWSQQTDFPDTPRHHPYQFTVGEYQYVGMGHGASIYNTLYRYDGSTDTWQAMADLPAEGRVAGTQFSFNGKGYLLSGDGDDHFYMETGEFWEYDVASDSWHALPAHPGKSRWAPGSFIIGNTLYFTSGLDYDKGTFVNDVLAFSLSPVSGVEPEVANNLSVTISPNPADESTYVRLLETNQQIDRITVYSLAGNLVKQINDVNVSQHELSLDELKTGIYLVSVTAGTEFSIKRLSIIH